MELNRVGAGCGALFTDGLKSLYIVAHLFNRSAARFGSFGVEHELLATALQPNILTLTLGLSGGDPFALLRYLCQTVINGLVQRISGLPA
jgi:hypothetical protein